MKTTMKKALPDVITFLTAGLVPMIVGSPAIGKSSLAKLVAKHFNLKLIDFRLSQADPTDLNGFPRVYTNKDGISRAGYTPMETFPLMGDALPEGYEGWLLFFDEANSCSHAVQAACYKILLDRMVGQEHLHEKVMMMAAGNLDTDNAITVPLSTALQSRLAHMELEVNNADWLEWAYNEGFDFRITAYLNYRPESLYSFRPDHEDSTYASPRTWEFANRLTKLRPMLDHRADLAVFEGVLGAAVAHEFLNFCKVMDLLPSFEDISTKGGTLPAPSDIGIIWMTIGMIGDKVNLTNIDTVMSYIDKFPIEFQVFAIRTILARNHKNTASYMSSPAIKAWVSANSKSLYGN